MKSTMPLLIFYAILLSCAFPLSPRGQQDLHGASSKINFVPTCDPVLWQHVYNPSRLAIHMSCVTVTGTVVDATNGKRKDGVRKEADGDTHGWLKLDPGQEQLLNAGNTSDEQGNLVYEVVCYFPVKQADAKSACRGYKNKVQLAPVGSHVSISGSWVMDDNHARWNEIHPVTAIVVIDN